MDDRICMRGDATCMRGRSGGGSVPAPAVVIRGSVGQNGRNDPGDSRAIQSALNRIDAVDGGPDPELKVDGLPWSKTIAAIRKFQMAQKLPQDGRVDPGGPTLRRLNEMLAEPPLEPNPYLVPLLLTQVIQARSCILAAKARLSLANASTPTLSQDARASANFHFALDKLKNPDQELTRIRGVYDVMAQVLARGYDDQDLAVWTGVFIPNTIDSEEEFVAWTVAGGHQHGGETGNLRGHTVRRDLIYVCGRFAFRPADERLIVILHELAHYCGPDFDTPDWINDYGKGWPDDAPVAGLPPHKRSRNADSFATFAFDAAFHRKAVRAQT